MTLGKSRKRSASSGGANSDIDIVLMSSMVGEATSKPSCGGNQTPAESDP